MICRTENSSSVWIFTPYNSSPNRFYETPPIEAGVVLQFDKSYRRNASVGEKSDKK